MNTHKVHKRVQRLHLLYSSVFSERTANYEAFCQMRIKIYNLNIKVTRLKNNLKTVSVHYNNTYLILKMIKKAKIFRVRVPLKAKMKKFSVVKVTSQDFLSKVFTSINFSWHQ